MYTSYVTSIIFALYLLPYILMTLSTPPEINAAESAVQASDVTGLVWVLVRVYIEISIYECVYNVCI